MSECRVSFAPGTDHEAATAQALECLRRNGVVVLDDVIDPALIARCKTEIEANYPDLGKIDRVRNYGPYEGRHTMGMRVEGALGERDILLPQPVQTIATALLGEMFMFDSFGLLVSVPGAPDQVRHPDGSLFPEVKVEFMLPPFALAVAMPLVPMDAISGPTAFWLGSHRKAEALGDHDFAPHVMPGSMILWDFRTKHCGLANRGTAPRPVIYSVLARYWWVEFEPPKAKLYDKLVMARAFHAALGERMQYRTRRAKLID